MLVASALFMAAVQDFENVGTAVSDVLCNIVQLGYAVFFFGEATAIAVARLFVSGKNTATILKPLLLNPLITRLTFSYGATFFPKSGNGEHFS